MTFTRCLLAYLLFLSAVVAAAYYANRDNAAPCREWCVPTGGR